MIKQRKRLTHSTTPQSLGCLASPEVSECAHCSYVLHEVLSHERRWLGVALRIMKNEMNAEDLVHEFYTKKLPAKIHGLNINDPSFNLMQYVARMVRNFAIDELYRTNRHGMIDAQYYVVGVTRDQEDQVMPNILRHVEARDELALIQRAITTDERALLNRMLMPGWTVSEEACNEHVTKTAIRARIVRLRKRLNKVLNPPPYSA
jgi:DNA-directed RNA polymerase specialized sigma24 family protein